MSEPVYGSPVVYRGYTYDVLFTIGDDVVIAERTAAAHIEGRVLRIHSGQVTAATAETAA